MPKMAQATGWIGGGSSSQAGLAPAYASGCEREHSEIRDSMTQPISSASAALRLVDREVWIVTAAVGERRGGLVATWVAQASLDDTRPVMAIALATNHYTAELVAESR